MSKLKILMVNDFSSNAYLFEKHLTAKVDAIYFNEDSVITKVKNPIFFKSHDLSSQVEQIKLLSDNYDVFICHGWIASAICYLANVKYVINFVDAYIEPEKRIRKKMPFMKKHLCSNLFEDSLRAATGVTSCGRFFTYKVRKYRSDVKEILGFTDPDVFTPFAKKIDLGQDKFTFFSPQRIEEGKGQLIMWEAIQNTKSDFVVLQTDWGQGHYYEEAMNKKPNKVKIIPKIKRENMPSHYVSSNALLGQISSNNSSHVENEAILCGIPVFCHTECGFTTNDPFCESNNPKEIAKYIDEMVEDKRFREEMIKTQSEWLKNTFDNKRNAVEWVTYLETLPKRNSPAKNKYSVYLNLYRKLKFIAVH